MGPAYQYRAEVLKIVDGDTVDLRTDLGFRIQRVDRFRLHGIDTPERGKPGYAEATAHLASLIPIGSMVVIVSHRPESVPNADSFGRWVVQIFAGGASVNEAMVRSGHAIPYLRARA